MHCEHNFVKCFLEIITRDKNTVKIQCDLQHRGIKPHLWLIVNPRKGGKMLKSTAPYVLTIAEFNIFASIIEIFKTPLGHVSDMGQCILGH